MMDWVKQYNEFKQLEPVDKYNFACGIAEKELSVEEAFEVFEDYLMDFYWHSRAWSDVYLYEQAREKILNKAKDMEWVTIRGKVKNYSVPKDLYVAYISKFYKYDDKYTPFLHKEWEPISSMHIKCQNDNPLHSDLCIAAGINIYIEDNVDSFDESSEYNDFTRGLYLSRMDIGKGLGGIKDNEVEIFNLTGAATIAKGKLYFVENPADPVAMNKKIVVLPNAHPKWTVIVQSVWSKGGVVISPVGGSACHLATVGRERSGCFLVITNIFDFDRSKKYTINLYDNIFSTSE